MRKFYQALRQLLPLLLISLGLLESVLAAENLGTTMPLDFMALTFDEMVKVGEGLTCLALSDCYINVFY
jgi:hypothetical protein